MNGGDGVGMTLGKALSKHYTTNTIWFGYGPAASEQGFEIHYVNSTGFQTMPTADGGGE